MTVHCAETLLSPSVGLAVAVMTVLPAATPVTAPVSETVATAGLSEA